MPAVDKSYFDAVDKSVKSAEQWANKYAGAVGAVTALPPALHLYDQKWHANAAHPAKQVLIAADAKKDYAKFEDYMGKKAPALSTGLTNACQLALTAINALNSHGTKQNDNNAKTHAAAAHTKISQLQAGQTQGATAFAKGFNEWQTFKNWPYL
jgi:hypothetical protein